MNILNRKQQQRGVGLLEVLIALVVIAVGVIAVLGLQGTLMSGSATTKARNEAMALARDKTEALRNAIERDQFDAELAVREGEVYDPDYKDGIKVIDGSGNGKIDGLNAQFTRSWNILDVESVENTREIVMQVTWTDAQGVKTHVELNTLITFARPVTSVFEQSDDEGVSPLGLPDTGYEGLHPDTPGDEHISNTYTPDSFEDRLGIKKILRYTNGHVQVRILDPDCAEADIVTDEGVDYCVVFTAFGGTLLRFNGTLYLDDLKKAKLPGDTKPGFVLLVRATTASYCAQEFGDPLGDLDSIVYQCYASGDCSNGGGAGCPVGAELAAMDELPDLNGGWRGRIGHFLYDDSAPYQAPPPPVFCMGKSYDSDENRDVDNSNVSRSYYGLRTDARGDKWREGINQSHSCHNTLLVGTASRADAVCDDGYSKMITAGIVWNSFKEDEVIRYLDAITEDEPNPNFVLGEETTYCDTVAIYGVIVEGTNVPANIKFTNLTVNMKNDAGSVVGACVGRNVTGSGIIAEYACNYVGDPDPLGGFRVEVKDNTSCNGASSSYPGTAGGDHSGATVILNCDP